MNRILPILIPDDGLRVVSAGTIGSYAMTLLNNPSHIIEVIAEKRRRALIKENNFRRWS